MQRNTLRRLRYATGYIDLGLMDDASDELEKVAFEDRFVPEVLQVRLELHMAAEHWETVIGIGWQVTQQTPDNERGWICWAYSLRELERIEEARDVLLKAEPIHGTTSALLHYNLACYYCLLGELSTARQCLARACKINPGYKSDALDDPDLGAIWGESFHKEEI